MENSTKKKVISQKAQAVSELVSAVIMIILFICKILEDLNYTKAMHNILNIMSPLLLIAIAVFLLWSKRYEKQPSDELSRELMLRSTAIAVKAELCAAIAVGVYMHLQGNYRHDEYYSITGSDIVMFGVFLCGIFFIVKDCIFLWLDRTPKAEDDE
ncbi:MAG: hypothetical protein J5724_01220 [Ruminococcus sp.]|nr:hypothetical protein [Ruminococcus sp.]